MLLLDSQGGVAPSLQLLKQQDTLSPVLSLSFYNTWYKKLLGPLGGHKMGERDSTHIVVELSEYNPESLPSIHGHFCPLQL